MHDFSTNQIANILHFNNNEGMSIVAERFIRTFKKQNVNL